MREIKFRAWDKIRKQWFYFVINSTPKDISKADTINFFGSVSDGDFYSQLEHWCEYTGLEDRNGNKIYEGDIVQMHYIGRYEIEYFRNGFYINDIIHSQFDESVEVIGNIHENPELLN